jgi:hypothetical protein
VTDEEKLRIYRGRVRIVKPWPFVLRGSEIRRGDGRDFSWWRVIDARGREMCYHPDEIIEMVSRGFAVWIDTPIHGVEYRVTRYWPHHEEGEVYRYCEGSTVFKCTDPLKTKALNAEDIPDLLIEGWIEQTSNLAVVQADEKGGSHGWRPTAED